MSALLPDVPATPGVKFTAIVNTPGYLPEGDDYPPVFDSARAAWYYLYHERNREEEDYPCPLCRDESTHGVFGDCDDDSEEARALAEMARVDEPGSVHLSTPGYDGGHDLGRAYSVQQITEAEAAEIEANS